MKRSELMTREFSINNMKVSRGEDSNIVQVTIPMNNLEKPSKEITEPKKPIITQTKNIIQKGDLPQNHENSCYLDSVLVALLLPDTLFVNYKVLWRVLAKMNSGYVFSNDSSADVKYRKGIQKIVKNLTKTMRGSNGRKNSSELVHELRTCLGQGNFFSTFSNSDAQDASDVLSALLDVFGLTNNVNSKQVMVHGTNDITSESPKDLYITSDRTEEFGLIIHLPTWKPNSTIEDNLSQNTDTLLDTPYQSPKGEFFRAITHVKYMINLFCVVHVDRTTLNTKNQQPFNVSAAFKHNGRRFKLMAAVLHQGAHMKGGHYTTLCNLDGEYHYYDDMKGGILIPLGNDFEVVKTKTKMDFTCTLLFYSL